MRSLVFVLASALVTQSARAECFYPRADVPGSADANAFGVANDGSLIVTTNGIEPLSRDPLGNCTQTIYPGRETTWAFGMNNDGVILGDVPSYDPGVNYLPGFIRVEDGSFGSFKYLGDHNTFANGINNRGRFFGTSPSGSFLREPDGSFASTAMPGALETGAIGIHNLGEVIGVADRSFRIPPPPPRPTPDVPWKIILIVVSALLALIRAFAACRVARRYKGRHLQRPSQPLH